MQMQITINYDNTGYIAFKITPLFLYFMQFYLLIRHVEKKKQKEVNEIVP